MSLKAIHLVFIAASTGLALSMGGWFLRNYFAYTRSATDLILGLMAVVVAVVLICYGRYFLKKLRNIGYL